MEERFETFTVLINRISRNIRKIKNQEMAEYDLRSTHISCLYYLYKEAQLTSTDLCERCEEDKATISRALSRLEADGYVLSRESEGKRYKAPIALSEKGKTVGGEIAAKIGAVLDSIGKELSPEERVEFYRCLNIISACLEKAANA